MVLIYNYLKLAYILALYYVSRFYLTFFFKTKKIKSLYVFTKCPLIATAIDILNLPKRIKFFENTLYICSVN